MHLAKATRDIEKNKSDLYGNQIARPFIAQDNERHKKGTHFSMPKLRTRLLFLTVLAALLLLIATIYNLFIPKTERYNSCDKDDTHFIGQLNLNDETATTSNIDDLDIVTQLGGLVTRPKFCHKLTSNKVAIIIPYRNRQFQLGFLLRHLRAVLSRQFLAGYFDAFGIFVVEQLDLTKFNRGLLLNIGFNESLQLFNNWNCFIFHDVDMVTENDAIPPYNCGPEAVDVVHLSVAIDGFKYEPPYAEYFGGVSAIPKNIFEKINGFSNLYFGWGSEDNDIFIRLQSQSAANWSTVNKKLNYRFKTWSHEGDEGNRPMGARRWLLQSTVAERMKYDGLNSLTYRLVETQRFETFTKFLVAVDEKEVQKAIFRGKKLI